MSVIEAEPIENSPNLEGAQATTLRSRTMRCAYLAQDRVDSSEAIKCLAQAMSKPKAGHMTQLKRVRYVKEVPRKALQQPSKCAFGSARGQRLGWRHSNASEEVWSDCAERTIFAQTQFNSTKRDWTSVVQKVSTTPSQREGVEDWVCNACLPTGT